MKDESEANLNENLVPQYESLEQVRKENCVGKYCIFFPLYF